MKKLDVLNWLIARSLYLKPTASWRDVQHALTEAKLDDAKAEEILVRGGGSRAA